MALNHRKMNGVRKSSSDHVKLKATSSPTSSDQSSSTRTSPRSPKRPVMETLEVDVDLANSRYSLLSPGRRCLSDSKINTRQRKDSVSSVTRKRKIDFDNNGQSSLSPSKFYRKSVKSSNVLHGTTEDRLKDVLDANQNNVKQKQKSPIPSEQLVTTAAATAYKSQHRIGRRRAASSFFSYSEATLSSPWNIGKSKKKRKKKQQSIDVSQVEGDCGNPKKQSPGSINGELASETSSEQDSVFEELEVITQTESSLRSPSGKNDKNLNKKINHLKRKPGRPRKSDSNNTGTPVVKKKGDITSTADESMVSSDGFRTRRLASLDAETKVHLMFEKESQLASEAKKSKTRRKRSVGKPTEYTDIKSPEKVVQSEDHCDKGDSIEDHFIDNCGKDINMIEDPIANIPIMQPECNIAGRVTCLNCGSETPAIYVHPPPSAAGDTHQMNSLPSVPLQTNRFNLMPTSPVQVLSEVCELFNDPDALMRRLSKLALRHTGSVDISECNYLKTLFKHRLAPPLSLHSISEPEVERVSSTLAQQLSSLINYNYNIPLSPTQSSTSTIARQKLLRKIIRPPGLKPAKEKLGRKKSTNGWRGVGDPVAKPIVYLNEVERELRYCYNSIKRKDDVISVSDCVLLRSGSRKKDIPFVAKISAIFEDTETGEIMISLLWYYRPEHTESGRQPEHIEQEIFACRHWDVNNVACIEDKCYVLPMSEYCRYQAELKRDMEGISPGIPVVPEMPPEIRHKETPDYSDTTPENVFLCRQVYDYKQRRLLKNPTCKFT